MAFAGRRSPNLYGSGVPYSVSCMERNHEDSTWKTGIFPEPLAKQLAELICLFADRHRYIARHFNELEFPLTPIGELD